MLALKLAFFFVRFITDVGQNPNQQLWALWLLLPREPDQPQKHPQTFLMRPAERGSAHRFPSPSAPRRSRPLTMRWPCHCLSRNGGTHSGTHKERGREGRDTLTSYNLNCLIHNALCGPIYMVLVPLGKGDHPSHYFISSLAPSLRRAHKNSYPSLPLPLFCGPVLSRLLFQTAAASIKQLQTEPCRADCGK